MIGASLGAVVATGTRAPWLGVPWPWVAITRGDIMVTIACSVVRANDPGGRSRCHGGQEFLTPSTDPEPRHGYSAASDPGAGDGRTRSVGCSGAVVLRTRDQPRRPRSQRRLRPDPG